MYPYLLVFAAIVATAPAAASELRTSAPDQFARFDRSISGSASGGTWTARNMIVGQTSTFTVAGGGDPIYLPSRPGKDGLAFL